MIKSFIENLVENEKLNHLFKFENLAQVWRVWWKRSMYPYPSIILSCKIEHLLKKTRCISHLLRYCQANSKIFIHDLFEIVQRTEMLCEIITGNMVFDSTKTNLNIFIIVDYNVENR